METRLKIRVTKEILERSKWCGQGGMISTNCAIALAVRDIFPRASVGPYIVFNTDNYCANSVDTPPVALDFIRLFDRTPVAYRPYLPEIEFEITITDEVLEQINIEELRPLLQNHPTLELVNI